MLPIIGMEHDNKYAIEAELSVQPEPHPYLNADDMARHDAEFRRVVDIRNQGNANGIFLFGDRVYSRRKT